MSLIRSSNLGEQKAKKVLTLLRAKKSLLHIPNKTVAYYIDSPSAAKKEFLKTTHKPE